MYPMVTSSLSLPLWASGCRLDELQFPVQAQHLGGSRHPFKVLCASLAHRIPNGQQQLSNYYALWSEITLCSFLPVTEKTSHWGTTVSLSLMSMCLLCKKQSLGIINLSSKSTLSALLPLGLWEMGKKLQKMLQKNSNAWCDTVWCSVYFQPVCLWC